MNGIPDETIVNVKYWLNLQQDIILTQIPNCECMFYNVDNVDQLYGDVNIFLCDEYIINYYFYVRYHKRENILAIKFYAVSNNGTLVSVTFNPLDVYPVLIKNKIIHKRNSNDLSNSLMNAHNPGIFCDIIDVSQSQMYNDHCNYIHYSIGYHKYDKLYKKYFDAI